MARCFIQGIVFVCMAALLGGCSVGMAMSGKKDPNLGAIQRGSSRGEVELHLGSPIKSVTNDDGTRMDVYEYEIGNEPSAGRAIGHGIMDVLTFGFWEILGTPIEGVQGDKFEITLLYDQDDTVKAINDTRKITRKKPEADQPARKVKVKCVGLSNDTFDGEEQDRKEALLDAKRKACEQAGVKLEFAREGDARLRDAEVEAESARVLAPGYEVVDVGYKADERTFQVVLVGEVLVPEQDGGTIRVE